MGVFPGLVRGFTSMAQGALQGEELRRERERQARMDLLAERLQQSQADLQRRNIESEIQRREDQTENERARLAAGAGKRQKLVDPVTGQVYGYDPVNNSITPATEADFPATPTQPSAPSRPARVNVAPANVPFTTGEGGTGVAQVTKGGQLLRTIPLGEKPLTPQERTAASRSLSAEQSVDNIERISRSNPQALNEAVAALRLTHYGKIGQAAADLRNAFSSSEGQELYGELSNVLLAVAPTYGGARPTEILLNLEQATSTPGVGGSKQALNTALRHMRDRLRDLRAQARLPTDSAPPAVKQPSPRVAPPGYHWDGSDLVKDQ